MHIRNTNVVDTVNAPGLTHSEQTHRKLLVVKFLFNVPFEFILKIYIKILHVFCEAKPPTPQLLPPTPRLLC